MSSTPRASSHELFAATVMLLLKKPGTGPELVQLLGCYRRSVSTILEALQDEGLVVESPGTPAPGARGPTPALWRWVGDGAC